MHDTDANENNILINNILINNNNTLLRNISNLPDVIIEIIKEYVPKKIFVFTNKQNYTLYHSLIKGSIPKYENYIRDIIRRDNFFVFEYIVRENFEFWMKIKNYAYKNMIFKFYLFFVIHYCIENDSNNCRNFINNFMEEHGLCKNLHKKNVVKYIR